MSISEEANKLDPMESAKKYVEAMKDFDKYHDDEEKMNELDVLWLSASSCKKAQKLLDSINMEEK